MSSIEDINETFQKSLHFVKGLTGLELQLSEKIELKRYAKMCTEIYDNETSPWHQINPDVESALIFLNKNYGTQIRNIGDFHKFNYQKNMDEKNLGFKYSEFFGKIQEEYFLP